MTSPRCAGLRLLRSIEKKGKPHRARRHPFSDTQKHRSENALFWNCFDRIVVNRENLVDLLHITLLRKELTVIPYASNTGSSRNLAALRNAGWHILLTPDNPSKPEGLRHAIDNGAWGCFQKGIEFQPDRFERLVRDHGSTSEFTVIPDIVAAGERSLQFSLAWIERLKHLKNPLLAVQDGMTVSQIRLTLREHPTIGIFLGGSTDWKLQTIREWGELANECSRYYHVGRVNTARRIRLCEEAGAHSFDGTSATKFSCTIPLLDHARKCRSLFRPKPPSLTEA